MNDVNACGLRLQAYSMSYVMWGGTLLVIAATMGLLPQSAGDPVTWLFAGISAVAPYAAWKCASVYYIYPDRIEEHRFYGWMKPRSRSNAEIVCFCERPDGQGRISRFEIHFAGDRLDLHRFQANFDVAINQLQRWNPAVPLKRLGKWAL